MNFRPMLIEDDYPDPSEGSDPISSLLNEQEHFARLSIERIRAEVVGSGLTEVTPERARHIAAASGTDPIPEPHQVAYRSVDLVFRLPEIPSPITASSRTLTVEKVFCVPAARKVVDSFIARALPRRIGELEVDWWASNGWVQRDRLYLCLTVSIPQSPDLVSTDDLWARWREETRHAFVALSRLIRQKWPAAQSATHEFWSHEIGLFFAAFAQTRSA